MCKKSDGWIKLNPVLSILLVNTPITYILNIMKALVNFSFVIAVIGILILSSCVVRPVASTVVVKPARRHAKVVVRPAIVLVPAPVVVVRGHRHRHHRR